MRLIRQFGTKMLLVELFGVFGLLVSGLILMLVQGGVHSPQYSFFSYRIRHLDSTAAWFVFVLIQMGINGLWLFRLAVLEGRVFTPDRSMFGYWGVNAPINPL